MVVGKEEKGILKNRIEGKNGNRAFANFLFSFLTFFSFLNYFNWSHYFSIHYAMCFMFVLVPIQEVIIM